MFPLWLSHLQFQISKMYSANTLVLLIFSLRFGTQLHVPIRDIVPGELKSNAEQLRTASINCEQLRGVPNSSEQLRAAPSSSEQL